jgi:hypothetical protein
MIDPGSATGLPGSLFNRECRAGRRPGNGTRRGRAGGLGVATATSRHPCLSIGSDDRHPVPFDDDPRRGNRTVNVEPTPGVDSASTDPPINRVSRRTMANPSPLPA